MMRTIHKGKHRAWPPSFGLFYDLPDMERVVEFDITAKYDFGTNDNDDVNKLFGWGYLNGLHHTDSVRFGWNWSLETGKVSLFAYCYVNKKRIIIPICLVETNYKYLLQIEKIGKNYLFTVLDAGMRYRNYGSTEVVFTHNKNIGYKLGCFFGGNNPAPHDITIKISKK
jgi:hypothetical protein